MDSEISAMKNSDGCDFQVTRRSFIKKTGGATVATAVFWNLNMRTLAADEDHDGYDDSVDYLLVCTASPTEAKKNPPLASDHTDITITVLGIDHEYRRVKTDQLECTGPNKGDVGYVEDKKFTITAKVTTVLKLQQKNGSDEWVDMSGEGYQPETRTAKETQDVTGKKSGELVWSAGEVVVDGLKSSTGQSGGVQESPVSGGLGIERGVVKGVRTAWAGNTGGYTIAVTVGVSPAAVKVELAGVKGASTLEWIGDEVLWTFKVMTKQEYLQWKEQNP